MEQTTIAHDGVKLRYLCSDHQSVKQALLLIIPFGLKLDLAKPFFDCFADTYRVMCWEARMILAPEEQSVDKQDLTVENHVADLFSVLEACGVDHAHVVGYCSGAGIALAAANARPEMFGAIVLVSGEYTMLERTDCVTQFGRDIDGILPMASRDRKTAQFILERMSSKSPAQGDQDTPLGLDLPFSKAHYLHRYALNYLSYRATNFEQLAQGITHPTLLVACGKDIQTNINSTVRLKSFINESSIFIDDGGDHYEILRDGTRVMSVIKDYLLSK